jgi:cytochrome c peroxidase
MINAVFNYTNFWDGRAHPFFNGETVIGPLDADAGIWIEVDGLLDQAEKHVRIPNSSLASQAVGPPLSTDEMSFIGRTFPDIGHKLLHPALRPLALQKPSTRTTASLEICVIRAARGSRCRMPA